VCVCALVRLVFLSAPWLCMCVCVYVCVCVCGHVGVYPLERQRRGFRAVITSGRKKAVFLGREGGGAGGGGANQLEQQRRGLCPQIQGAGNQRAAHATPPRTLHAPVRTKKGKKSERHKWMKKKKRKRAAHATPPRFFFALTEKKKNLQRGIILQVHRIHELFQYRQILCCHFWHLALARRIYWWKGDTRVWGLRDGFYKF
jgi:hypothetical protein